MLCRPMVCASINSQMCVARLNDGIEYPIYLRCLRTDMVDCLAGGNDSADNMLDESSLSENEDEWVPSSWDSLAKPIRSALKSPDKSSSVSIILIMVFDILYAPVKSHKIYSRRLGQTFIWIRED